LSLHDFRIIREKNKKKAIFEIVVPFELKISRAEILKKLNEEISKEAIKIELHPVFETPYLEQ
jgi:hypothetical protein